MSDLRLPVLIGDNQPERAEWLSHFLGEYYNVAARTADTFGKVYKLVRDLKWSVVFLADTLPHYDIPEDDQPESQLTQSFFSQLRGIDRKVRFVCVVTRDTYMRNLIDFPHQICYARLPSQSPSTAERDQIIEALKPHSVVLPLVTITVKEIETLSSWREDDRALPELIRSLSLEQDLNDGRWHLFQIIRNCLDCRDVEGILIESLTQGKSGARIFHLTVTRKGGAADSPDEYVLKLSGEKDVWKLQSEVRGYLQAKKSKAFSRYKRHMPALETPQFSKLASTPIPKGPADPPPEEFAYMANNLTWNAIHYDFLGGSLGECMSLETALVSSRDKLRKKLGGGVHKSFSLLTDGPHDLNTFRLDFIDTLLTALSDIWYLRAEGGPKDGHRREAKLLWETGDPEDDRTYVPMPPYQLNTRTKRWAHELLESEEAEMGSRVFRGWEECRYRVLALINCDGGPAPGALGRELPVVLTPVHGDLNTGNVFLWLREAGFPFLIDLPFYQPLGHALQDFARLEVDVKFILMDRQKESPASRLAAYDYSPTQARLWQELEWRLLDDGAARTAEPDWQARGFRDNVRLSFRLVQLIRDKAEIVQRQALPGDSRGPAPFMDEYLPALLYHTIRAATYPSLSIFKRLFAVYSAGMILRRLGLTLD